MIWSWKFAWRETRARWRRLILWSAPITVGTAAVVAIAGFGNDLRDAIEHQAKALLGADLVIASQEPFTPEAETLFQSIPGARAREISFASMVSFPKHGGARLVSIRAVSDGFPFYGQLETEPPGAQFRAPAAALLEQTLLQQFGARPGDSVKIGSWTAPIAGTVLKAPGESFVFSSFAPRVFIPLESATATGLLGRASLARFKIFFQLPDSFRADDWLPRHRGRLEALHLSSETVESRKRNLGRAMENLYEFLHLTTLVALFLGGIGIASAVHLQFEEKAETAALLRCLGARASEAFGLFLLEVLAMSILSTAAGAALGLVIHRGLPAFLSGMLPFPIQPVFSFTALLKAIGLGLLTSILFALLPLAPLRRVSPLAALRSAPEVRQARRGDPVSRGLRITIILAVLLLAVSQARRWQQGILYCLALLAVFAAFGGLAQAIFWTARRPWPRLLPYFLRQGIANLHRPRNRTRLILFSAGLGIFLLLTIFWIEFAIVRGLVPEGPAGQPNAVLFDVQSDQLKGVETLLQKHQLPILQDSPIITMRLAAINGQRVESIRRQLTNRPAAWALRREYRSTYQRQLSSSEKLIAGQWISQVNRERTPVPVSLESGIAQELKVSLGDSLLFNIEGAEVATTVASLREVDWRRLQPNFFVVFPSGALDQAPQTHILATRVERSVESGPLQRELVQTFPNVSFIDLNLVLQTIESVLDKIAFASRFLAFLTVTVGLLILAFSILAGRHQRLAESVLLRTLGATRRQVLLILAVEYGVLGFAASLASIALGSAASWALCHFVFKISWSIPAAGLWLAAGAGIFATTTVGLLTSWGIFREPPLEILRREG